MCIKITSLCSIHRYKHFFNVAVNDRLIVFFFLSYIIAIQLYAFSEKKYNRINISTVVIYQVDRSFTVASCKGSVFQSSSFSHRACDFLVASLFSSRFRLVSRTLFGDAREPLGRQQPMKNSGGTARWRGQR